MGVIKWKARFNGPGFGSDVPSALAVDGWGNVYVAGSSFGVGTGLDFVTIKYNSWGSVQWIARFNGAANRDDVPNALAIDSAGNVYVTGSSQSTSGDRDFQTGTLTDYATVKYNVMGVPQWVRRFNGSANAGDSAVGIAVP